MVRNLIAIVCLAASSALALPDGGRQVEWIETDGKAWIDSGLHQNIDIGYFLDMEYTNSYPVGQRMAMLWNSQNAAIGIVLRGQMTASFIYGNCNQWWVNTNYAGRMTFSFNFLGDQKLLINGYEKTDLSSKTHYNSTNTFFDTIPIFITVNSGIKSPGNGFSPQRIYGYRFSDGANLVRDFIAALDATNAPCLYDKVTGRYFYNVGTGSFVAGPLVSDGGYGIRTKFRNMGGAQ